jgi:hypothetical protein
MKTLFFEETPADFKSEATLTEAADIVIREDESNRELYERWDLTSSGVQGSQLRTDKRFLFGLIPRG